MAWGGCARFLQHTSKPTELLSVHARGSYASFTYIATDEHCSAGVCKVAAAAWRAQAACCVCFSSEHSASCRRCRHRSKAKNVEACKA